MTILALFFTLNVQGQDRRVQSKMYNAMLKTLLSHTVPEISVQQLTAQTEAILLVDAREQKEYAVSHIRQSVWVGYDNSTCRHWQMSLKTSQLWSIVRWAIGVKK